MTDRVKWEQVAKNIWAGSVDGVEKYSIIDGLAGEYPNMRTAWVHRAGVKTGKRMNHLQAAMEAAEMEETMPEELIKYGLALPTE